MNPHAADPERRALIPALWPARDLAAWAQATSPSTSLFSDVGCASHWGEPTCRSVSQSYGRWLGFLERSGWLDRKAGPAERITPDHLEAYFLHLKAGGNRRATIVKRFGHLAMALQVMVPGFEAGFVTRPNDIDLADYLPDDRLEKRIFDSRILLDLSMTLFNQGIAMHSDARRCNAVRDAALLGLLATCAPRRRSVHAMEVGLQLTRGGNTYRLRFRPENMKASNELDYDLLDALTPVFDRYLEVERCELLKMAGHRRVWVNWTGAPLGIRGIGKAVRERTRRHLGHELGIQIFRHCLTTTAVLISPQAALDIPVVLGHTPAVSRRNYNRATAVVAVGRHGDRMAERTRRLSSLAAAAYGWPIED